MREAFRLRVDVEDEGVCGDLDTPKDYARWKIPSVETLGY
jgi:hypothetical protein